MHPDNRRKRLYGICAGPCTTGSGAGAASDGPGIFRKSTRADAAVFFGILKTVWRSGAGSWTATRVSLTYDAANSCT
ncbi:hypothetical protein DPMN_051510 [Dreissena polymorpha]|uniref:Uncharacterized protein n=1 Tax=Dreissena polymorpha TaxID=45954 RepID=A0A9D4CK34_DREPO|nr:hypothetical protein DPMN_051510 [Dreissena polymorpha]